MVTLVAQSARRDEDLVQSIGVSTHLTTTSSSYGDLAAVQSQLSYLNIDHVRSDMPSYSQASIFQTLGAAGIKFDLINMNDPALNMATLDLLAPYLTSIEGPNEVNVTIVHYNGLVGVPAAIALQQALYADVHNDPVLNGNGRAIPVLNFSVSLGNSYAPYGNLSAYADYTNVHAYGQYGVPSAWFSQAEVAGVTDTPGRPAIVTETGNTTRVGDGAGVTEAVQAKLVTYTLLDDFQNGVVSTYIYQLEDGVADPTNTDDEDHFGLFNVDGTPKAAAIAVHDLTTILGDAGSAAQSFTTAPLTYGLTNLPYYGNQMLLEKSNGVYDLALWAEQRIWDYTNNVEIPIAAVTVTVTFGQVYQVINVYDVQVGTIPIATYYNVSSIQVALADDSIIVEVEPNALGTLINTGAAGGVFSSPGADTVSGGSGAATVNVLGTATVTGSTGALTVALGGTAASVNGGAGTLSVTSSSGINTVTGGTGTFGFTNLGANDVVTTGTSTHNTVALGSGSDTVTVNGVTTLTGGSGAATVTLNTTGNSIRGGTGTLTVTDNAGYNTITGGTGALVVNGLVGNDVITTSAAASNSVVLGSGSNNVAVRGATVLTAGTGAASVVINAAGSSIQGGAGALTIIDHLGHNTIIGGAGALNLSDLAGNDVITTGTSASNRLTLGTGNDTVTVLGVTTLLGGAGAAMVTLNASGSSIVGGTGALTVVDNGKSNTVIGGTGAFSYTNLANSTAIITGKSSSNKVVLGSGNDTVNAVGATILTGGTGAFKVTLGASGSLITGGAGTFSVIDNKGGNTITGGAGALTVYANGGGDIVTTNNTSGTSSVNLGPGSDTVFANGATFVAPNASNTVINATGMLSVNGGSGSMTVNGGGGGDYVFTQANTSNLINLGSGTDLVLSHGADTINASTVTGAAAGQVFAAASVSITGGAGALLINGPGTGLTVKGGTGAITDTGVGSNSSVIGGSGGGNVLNAAGGNVTLAGGGAGDRLSDTGSKGSNMLIASARGATLTAAGGSDTLIGGSGTDAFIVAAAASATMIQNYQSGTDHLSFSGFNSSTPIASQIVVGGNLQLTLSNKAIVTLAGVTHL